MLKPVYKPIPQRVTLGFCSLFLVSVQLVQHIRTWSPFETANIYATVCSLKKSSWFKGVTLYRRTSIKKRANLSSNPLPPSLPPFPGRLRECQDAGVEGVCGIFEERSNGGSSFTGSVVPNVCGRVVGWIGAQTSCGAIKKAGETFPNDYPYDCDRAARHGTFEQARLN